MGFLEILPALAAFGVTVLLVPLWRRFLVARGMVDLPDDRRSHRQPTPRGGGVVMVLGLVVAVVLALPFYSQAIGFGALALAAGTIGWLDDRKDIGVGIRLTAQALIALAMLAWLGPVASVGLAGMVLDAPVLWSVLAVVAVVWLINLHNFMDGSDGLAAGQGVWAGLAFCALFFQAGASFESLAALCLASACAGFLVWNRPPAALFMGDSGSILIGACVAFLAFAGAAAGSVSIWASLIVCGVFVVDSTLTLGQRLARGDRWYTPHRQHAYQRLIAGGWTHRWVLLAYALVNLLVAMPLLLAAICWPELDFWLALGYMLVLAGGWWTAQRAGNGEQD